MTNVVNILKTSFVNTSFNNILPPKHKFPKRTLAFRVFDDIRIYFSKLFHSQACSS